jgi:hypothetical protein
MPGLNNRPYAVGELWRKRSNIKMQFDYTSARPTSAHSFGFVIQEVDERLDPLAFRSGRYTTVAKF